MKKYLDINLFIAPGANGSISVSAVSRTVMAAAAFNCRSASPMLPQPCFVPGMMIAASATPKPRRRSPAPAKAPATMASPFSTRCFRTVCAMCWSRNQTAARFMPDDTGVRIRLSIAIEKDGMGEIASIPWELMRSPDDISPLVVTNTALVRTLASDQPTEPRPIRDTLNILAITSNPPGTDPLDIARELDAIEQQSGPSCRMSRSISSTNRARRGCSTNRGKAFPHRPLHGPWRFRSGAWRQADAGRRCRAATACRRHRFCHLVAERTTPPCLSKCLQHRHHRHRYRAASLCRRGDGTGSCRRASGARDAIPDPQTRRRSVFAAPFTTASPGSPDRCRRRRRPHDDL